jgi:endonuclease YncB( thermonuclease family)
MGAAATQALAKLMQGKAVVCEERAKDRYGRTVALCRADGIDLSAAMVRSGWAFAFVRYSRDYVALEEKARAENVGLHPFHCELPWARRARSRGDK